jgi:methyl-accepting chemotaxis protein
MTLEPHARAHRRAVALGVFAVACGSAALGVHHFTGSLAAALALQVGLGAAGVAVNLAYGRRDHREAEALASALRALARGESPPALPQASGSDVASDAFLRLRDHVLNASTRLESLGSRVERLPSELTRAMAEVERSAADQEGAVEETASLLANMGTQVHRINEEVDNLARSNEETAASIQQMSTAIEQVARSAQVLQENVESSTASLHQMGTSIGMVAKSSDDVQQVAQETAASVTQMDRAIQEVGEHVRGAAHLTARATESAEEGSAAVMATIQGIQQIRTQTTEARKALEGLAKRIEEIGEIATVIGAVSDETNLLSLNAAIIAAQAGEHGKPFAVVADQVKTLARRTSESVKQIEEMIRCVQSGSAAAVKAMASGIESVEEGASRSRVAGDALEAIRRAARQASGQVEEISRATEEQARNSKHVASAAQRVSEHVSQISRAMAEQSTASQSLLRNADRSLDMCRQMAHAMDEQRSTGRYITQHSDGVTEMIRKIQNSTASHRGSNAAVAERFDGLVQAARRSCERIPEVARHVESLVQEAQEARNKS